MNDQAEQREPSAGENQPAKPSQQRPAQQPSPQTRASSDSGEPRLTADAWKEYARLKFGVSPHAIAGALAHRDPAEEITEADVQKALDEFADRPGVEDAEEDGE